MTDGYERRISAEEAREGYLFVEKARLSFFPPLGQRVRILCLAPDRYGLMALS